MYTFPDICNDIFEEKPTFILQHCFSVGTCANSCIHVPCVLLCSEAFGQIYWMEVSKDIFTLHPNAYSQSLVFLSSSFSSQSTHIFTYYLSSIPLKRFPSVFLVFAPPYRNNVLQKRKTLFLVSL